MAVFKNKDIKKEPKNVITYDSKNSKLKYTLQ